MDTEQIDSSLLYLEVPLYVNGLKDQRFPDIVIDEGATDKKIAEKCCYEDNGGGIDFFLNDSDDKRTIYWKTSGNILELHEISLQFNLLQNRYQIVFQNSKVFPDVQIFYINQQLIILCATLHAAHRIILNTNEIRKNRSSLSDLNMSLFAHPSHNFYFTEVQKINCFSSNLIKVGKQPPGGAMFAFGIDVGNVKILKFPMKGQAVLARMNQASRISRLWSGINPWASDTYSETPCEICVISVTRPKVVGVCRDHKLRIWSCKTYNCTKQVDLCEYTFEDFQPEELGKNHKIRFAKGDEDDGCFVSVYMSFSSRNSMFVNFEFDIERNYLSHISTLQCGGDVNLAGLIDFKLTSSGHLWALWEDTDEEMCLSVCDTQKHVWHDVATTPLPLQEVSIASHSSVQEAYLHQLFSSGNFYSLAIAKALSISQRSAIYTRNMSVRALRENVIRTVNTEIDNLLPEDGSATLNETIEAQMTSWQNFYQTCLQYQKFVSKPFGITSPALGDVFVVKKDFASHLVSVSDLDAVCRGADPAVCCSLFPDEPHLQDFGKLLRCLSSLANIIGQDYLDTMLQSLMYYDNPIEAVESSLVTIRELMSDRTDHYELEESVANIGDLASAVNMLLICLDPGATQQRDIASAGNGLESNCGVEILVRVVQRYVNDRLQLSLLLLMVSILFDRLKDTVPSRVSLFIQAYNAVKWAVTTETECSSQTSLENNLQSLTVQDTQFSNPAPRLLIEYYLNGEGGKLLMGSLGFTTIHYSMMPQTVAKLVQLLWPLGPTMSFPEFLLSKRQLSSLQHYLDKQLYPWCDFSPSYTTYLLGYCHLYTGKYNKAVQIFLQAGGKLAGDEPPLNEMMQVDGDANPGNTEIRYYTKILEIFEEFDLNEQAITVATHAIGKAGVGNPCMPRLCSSVFHHTLSLHRHDDAYKAIVWNPDPTHRKDCLRAFVVALCERKQYKTLVEYPYDDMQEDLVSILEHRARCSDLLNSTHKYYDLLFAFHVYRGNYRRASSVMYEQSWRIGTEHRSVSALKQKHICLISAVSCLLLVNPDNQWIVHPETVQKAQNEGSRSPKRDYEGEELDFARGNRKVVICELKNMQKEIVLVEARLKMANEIKADDIAGAAMTAQETVALLNHVGLFEEAFSICMKFNLPFANTFHALTTRCVRSSYSGDDTQTSSWISKHDQLPVTDGHSSASDEAWRLLQQFLEKYGTTDSSSGNYRAVLTTLLSYNYKIPAWFINKYKQLNCPELLRMLICYDYLELATNICLEYIDAVLGVGPEHFNIKSTLSSVGQQVWLPYNELEQLLYLLKGNVASSTTMKNMKLHEMLSAKIQDYVQQAEKVSSMQSLPDIPQGTV